jgi:hypothetical protein
MSLNSDAQTGRFPYWTAGVLILLIIGCSVYANLAFAVTNPDDFRYFPPFKRAVNANDNRHLGAEYINIARSMVGGKGYASPFGGESGPTAWMPPVLPTILAGIVWACNGNDDAVMVVFIFMQVYVLIATGLLVMLLARRTCGRLGARLAALIFFLGLLYEFRACFQFTHDCFIVMLAVDLLIAGLCWLEPLRGKWTAAGWGVFGALCALTNPLVGFVWGIASSVIGIRKRAWSQFATALLLAGLALLPWTIRNYAVFGKLIPVKSNLAYELYQSQCLQKDGLIQRNTFSHHPFRNGSKEGQEYRAVGEVAFIEHKSAQFWQAVWADPADFLDRAANRFLGATLWYLPFDRANEPRQRPWVFLASRFVHPLAFLGLLVLLFSSLWKPLHPAQWSVMGVYVLYLFPYAAVSYYDRYAVPLLGAKILLVIWGMDRLLPARSKRAADIVFGDSIDAVAVGEEHVHAVAVGEDRVNSITTNEQALTC